MKYELYLPGSSKPDWIYRRHGWLTKRLDRIARDTQVESAIVNEYRPSGALRTKYSVWFGLNLAGRRIWET